MTLQMSEMSRDQIEIGRYWVERDLNDYNIPVAKTYLHALFNAAEKYLDLTESPSPTMRK